MPNKVKQIEQISMFVYLEQQTRSTGCHINITHNAIRFHMFHRNKSMPTIEYNVNDVFFHFIRLLQ